MFHIKFVNLIMHVFKSHFQLDGHQNLLLLSISCLSTDRPCNGPIPHPRSITKIPKWIHNSKTGRTRGPNSWNV